MENNNILFTSLKSNSRHKHAKWPPSDLTPWTNSSRKSRSKFTQYCAQFTLGPNQKCRMGAEQSIFCQNHEWKFWRWVIHLGNFLKERETIQKRNMTHIFFVSNFHEFLKEKMGWFQFWRCIFFYITLMLYYFIFYLCQRMGIKRILLIQSLIQPISLCIVVQPQKSLTKRKDFWAHGKVKIGKRHKSHSASNFTHIHTLCILFSSWIASVKQASWTVIWFLNFHSEIVWDKTCFEN